MPWNLTGNAGTNPANNFLGTTDNRPLIVRTNRVEALRVTPNGNVGIQNTAPAGRLHIGAPTPDIFLVGNTTTDQDGLRIHYNESAGLRTGVIDVKGSTFQIRGEDGAVGQGATHRMFIDLANGNVGIGTTNPDSKLDVEGSTQLPSNMPSSPTIIHATNSGAGYAVYGSIDQGNTFGGLAYEADDVHEGRFGEVHSRYGVRGESQLGFGVGGHSDNGVGVVGSTTNNLAGWFFGPVAIENNHTNTPALRVGGLLNQNAEFGGSLLIGTGLPTQTAGRARIIIGADTANNDIEIGSANPQIQDVSFWNTGSGNLMDTHARAYYTTSDARLKRNVRPLTDVIERLEQIRGVSFEWNDGRQSPGHSNERQEVGVIAQEVEAVFPELVSTSGNEGYKTVDYGRLTAILVEAVKELKAENGMLQSRLEALEQRLIS
jgi:endosialidase-like protein